MENLKKDKPLKFRAIEKDRFLHIEGVANYMRKHAPEYGVDPDMAYLVGLLHDVGYIYGVAGHEENGAKILKKAGFIYADMIGIHGTSVADVKKEGIKIEPMMALLYEADMMIDVCKETAGKMVGARRRMEGTASRYGEGSRPHKGIQKHWEGLKDLLSSYGRNIEKLYQGIDDDI